MTSGNVSREMMDAVEGVLPIYGDGITPKAAFDLLGMWALISVRHALRQLVEEGRVGYTGHHCNRLYRRIPQ